MVISKKSKSRDKARLAAGGDKSKKGSTGAAIARRRAQRRQTAGSVIGTESGPPF